MDKVLCAALALFCILAVNGEVQVQSNFNINQFLGKWYIIGMASDARWFTTRKEKFQMSTILMKPAENDTVETILTKQKCGECYQIIFPYKKTEQEGRFKFHSDRWNNDQEVYVTRTNYDEYAVVHSILTKGSEITTLVKLYGRGQELRQAIVERFRQYCLEQGLEKENILTFAKQEECRPKSAQN
uniref:lipocalin-like n=1 Tax=Pristiophorus japonicus TaxID=55135 RepID=UPI00398F2225